MLMSGMALTNTQSVSVSDYIKNTDNNSGGISASKPSSKYWSLQQAEYSYHHPA